MNREQKIALIIGFAVILVVGVLVSDHWSRARQLELADASEGDAGLVEGPPVAPLPSPGETPVGRRFAENQPDQSAVPAEVTPPPEVEPSLPVVAIEQGTGRSDSPLGDALANAGADRNPVTFQPGSLIDLINEAGDRVQNGWENGVPAAAGYDGRSPQQSEQPRDAGPAPEATKPEPPKPARHTVARNESLFAIAKRYYGDGNKWRLIVEANPKKVTQDGKVREGVTLEIPGATAGSGQAQPLSPAPTKPAARKPRESAPRPTTYTVRKNDSLSQIAQRFLGSAKRMGEIIAANRGKIDDPDDIRVGMVLTIPSQP